MRIRRLRFLIILILIALLSVTATLAQTSTSGSTVSITVQTGATAAAGNLDVTLSGTFPGDPFATSLGQSGGFHPTQSNTYNFNVPYSFCQLFQFQMTYDGTDSWDGQSISISVNGQQVWQSTSVGTLTAGSSLGATWDNSAAYTSACPTTQIQLITVTGADGTVDNPNFYLLGTFSASPYRFLMDQPGDLQPNKTDTYNFPVPMSFCDMTSWRIVKGTTNGVDDDWGLNALSLKIGSDRVYSNSHFAQSGPITSTSMLRGTLNGSDYKTECSASALTATAESSNSSATQAIPTAMILPSSLITQAAVLQPPPPPAPSATPTTAPHFNIIPTATNTPLHIVIAIIPTGTPTLSFSSCPGAPPPRLHVGGTGTVTEYLGLPLYASPTTASALLVRFQQNATFTVIGGPACSDGYIWWEVTNRGGTQGWLQEGKGSTYWLAPS